MDTVLIEALFEIGCLLVGMHGLFRIDNGWRWLSASTVVLATINLLI